LAYRGQSLAGSSSDKAKRKNEKRLVTISQIKEKEKWPYKQLFQTWLHLMQFPESLGFECNGFRLSKKNETGGGGVLNRVNKVSCSVIRKFRLSDVGLVPIRSDNRGSTVHLYLQDR